MIKFHPTLSSPLFDRRLTFNFQFFRPSAILLNQNCFLNSISYIFSSHVVFFGTRIHFHKILVIHSGPPLQRLGP